MSQSRAELGKAGKGVGSGKETEVASRMKSGKSGKMDSVVGKPNEDRKAVDWISNGTVQRAGGSAHEPAVSSGTSLHPSTISHYYDSFATVTHSVVPTAATTTAGSRKPESSRHPPAPARAGKDSTALVVAYGAPPVAKTRRPVSSAHSESMNSPQAMTIYALASIKSKAQEKRTNSSGGGGGQASPLLSPHEKRQSPVPGGRSSARSSPHTPTYPAPSVNTVKARMAAAELTIDISSTQLRKLKRMASPVNQRRPSDSAASSSSAIDGVYQ